MTALILLSEWQKSQIEFWRKVKGWPAYDVSSFGRVRSYWEPHNQPVTGYKGYHIGKTPRVLIWNYDKRGYPKVLLNHRRRKRVVLIHRLVAENFLPNPEDKPQVNHKNALRTDGRLDNLEWATRSENMRHAFDAGLYDGIIKRGESNRLTTITDDQVLAIRKLSALGISNNLIARVSLINKTHVGRIVNGKARIDVQLKEINYHGRTSWLTRRCDTSQ